MGRWYRWVGGWLVILSWGVSLDGQPTHSEIRIPAVQGISFAGQAVSLPQDLQGKVGVLVIGFTQSSRDSVKGWGMRLSTDFAGSAGVVFYEMPVLASVPRMLRGYVTGKVKESVSEQARPHFVAIIENETAWRGVTNYKGGDDAYVLLVDGEGVIRWQVHGSVSDDEYARLKDRIKGRTLASAHLSE